MGWTREYRQAFEEAFYVFLDHCFINSKDLGANTCLGENLYDGQIRFITGVFDALERGIHRVYVLKSRQLGISTIARALSLFYLGTHKGLGGALVMDTDFNKKAGRSEIETMIRDLPVDLQFPRIKPPTNRDGLTLSNDARMLFMSAGVRASKSSGTLGRSVGLSFAHLSELCSYENDEGLEAFEQSLSEVNPERLYIYESTARGPNSWQDMWEEARKDTAHCFCIFLGWWSKPSQSIDRDDPDFKRYGLQPPTRRELEKIRKVKELYDHEITPEQLAWIRRKMDPNAEPEGDVPAEYEGSATRIQEQPWVEDESWQMTGSVFFAPEDLTNQWNKFVSKKFETYMFTCGLEFTDMRVWRAPTPKSVEFKVWQPPHKSGAVYIVSADVAFGSSEKNDRSSVQVLRCFADGADQEAEYAWPLINTRQFAWVIMAIAAWYAQDGANDVYLIIELNGPGASVWDEIVHLRSHVQSGYQPTQIMEKGLFNVFNNVRNYIYVRPDAIGHGGGSFQWKTTPGPGPTGKVRLMEGLRDFVSNGQLHIRSMDTITEMKAVTREEDKIEAQGKKKDDRVVALAIGIRCWRDRVRRTLSSLRRTREFEENKEKMSVSNAVALFNQNMMSSFFSQKEADRRNAQLQFLRGRRAMRTPRKPRAPRAPRGMR
ncbi:MAG: hypothetical protein C5B50_00660 [Verrucomicrobia bacterium]|nr:MAG: hypothetical protein C5B50_00660 [Verrucomicrobiota bacterium]